MVRNQGERMKMLQAKLLILSMLDAEEQCLDLETC